MAVRVNEVAARAPTRWQRFVDECTTYIEMALEPEIQRIMFRDGPEGKTLDPAQSRIVESSIREAELSGVGLEGPALERFQQIDIWITAYQIEII